MMPAIGCLQPTPPKPVFAIATMSRHSTANAGRSDGHSALTQLVAGFVVHKDRLIVRLKSDTAEDAFDAPDDRSLTIPCQKPPSKRARQILLPNNTPRSEIRPERFERWLRLVSAIARGR